MWDEKEPKSDDSGSDLVDEEFVASVYKDIDDFMNRKHSGRCVLVFPPLNSKLRFLIHKVGELFSLATFSVGEGLGRLTIVCPYGVALLRTPLNIGAPSTSRYRDPQEIYTYSDASEQSSVDDTHEVMDKSAPKRSPKDRKLRPDAPIYVPPAIRRAQQQKSPAQSLQRNTEQMGCTGYPNGQNYLTDSEVEEQTVLLSDVNIVYSSPPVVPECTVIHTGLKLELDGYIDTPPTNGSTEPTEDEETENDTPFWPTETSAAPDTQDSPAPDTQDSPAVTWAEKETEKETDHDQEELLRANEEFNRRNKKFMKHSLNKSDVLIISDTGIDPSDAEPPKEVETTAESAPVECWEDLLEEGLLDEHMISQITEKVGKVEVTKPKLDYEEYRTKINYDSDYSHVLEIYNFPKEFKTHDLISICDSLNCGTYHIKWVDDNHALGVFSSGFVANEVLKSTHPLVKFRPLSQASKQSINKIKRYPNAFVPIAVRPQTCPQTARRMVSGALGLKLENAREERAKEIKILKEAREKKKLSSRQQDEAWEGKPASK